MSNLNVSDTHLDPQITQFVNAKGGAHVNPNELASSTLAFLTAQTTDLLDAILNDELDFDNLQEEVEQEYESLSPEMQEKLKDFAEAVDNLPKGEVKAKAAKAEGKLPPEVQEKVEKLGKELLPIVQKLVEEIENHRNPTNPSSPGSISTVDNTDKHQDALSQMMQWLTQVQAIQNEAEAQQSQMRVQMSNVMQTLLQNQYVQLADNMAHQHHGFFHKLIKYTVQTVVLATTAILAPEMLPAMIAVMVLLDLHIPQKLDTAVANATGCKVLADIVTAIVVVAVVAAVVITCNAGEAAAMMDDAASFISDTVTSLTESSIDETLETVGETTLEEGENAANEAKKEGGKLGRTLTRSAALSGTMSLQSTGFAIDVIKSSPWLKKHHKFAAAVFVLIEVAMLAVVIASGKGEGEGEKLATKGGSGIADLFKSASESVKSFSPALSDMMSTLGDTLGSKDTLQIARNVKRMTRILQGEIKIEMGIYDGTVKRSRDKDIATEKAKINDLQSTMTQNNAGLEDQVQHWKQSAEQLNQLLSNLAEHLSDSGRAAAQAIAKNA